MIYGYARVSTDGQIVDAQVKQLRADRAELRRAIAKLESGDVLTVTRLDRLARSTRDLLNTLAQVADKGAGFRSLRDAWADTTTPHGRLMLTVLAWISHRHQSLRLGGNFTCIIRRLQDPSSDRAGGPKTDCFSLPSRQLLVAR